MLSSDFYTLLQIPRDASPNDIKTAYHRTLLRLHPDKQPRSRHNDPRISIAADATARAPEEASIDMALLKEAYKTLSDPSLRAAYDALLGRGAHGRSHGPRPAQVVSLEEFIPALGEGRGADADADADADTTHTWWYRCRCGGRYRITQDDLEDGTHLIGCESCSEAIWVGYEAAPEVEDE